MSTGLSERPNVLFSILIAGAPNSRPILIFYVIIPRPTQNNGKFLKADILMNQRTIITIFGVFALISVAAYFTTTQNVEQSLVTTSNAVQQPAPTPIAQQPLIKPSITQPAPKASSNSQTYIEVKELGFKIPVDSSMAGEVTYKIDGQAVAFSTKTLNAISRDCESGGGGSISKIPGTPSNPVGIEEVFGGPASVYFEARMANIKQFNDFFLIFLGPQSICTNNRHDLESQVIQVILNGFKDISLISQ